MRNVKVLLSSQIPFVLSGLERLMDTLQTRFKSFNGNLDSKVRIILKQEKIDVAILDLSLREADYYNSIRETAKQFPKLKIILLTYNERTPWLVTLAEMGIQSIMSLSAPSKEIENAFRSVLMGDRYHSVSIEEYIREQILKNPVPANKFSSLQKKLVSLIAQGYTTKEIALQLSRAKKTIENCRYHLLKKTGCKNTFELISLFHRHNLLDEFSKQFDSCARNESLIVAV